MSGPSMLIILLQRLITDPDNRQHFYQVSGVSAQMRLHDLKTFLIPCLCWKLFKIELTTTNQLTTNRLPQFQEVFPQKYGPEYYKAVELLVMKFLVALERLLVVPNLQQVTYKTRHCPLRLQRHLILRSYLSVWRLKKINVCLGPQYKVWAMSVDTDYALLWNSDGFHDYFRESVRVGQFAKKNRSESFPVRL